MQSAPNAIATPSPEAIVGAAVEQLAQLYHAKGDLELSFVRQIAGAQFTIDSLERTVLKLSAGDDPDTVDTAAIDRLTRIQARKQRMITVALKELKALQSLRNAIERFPSQTKDLPPLADQTPFIGLKPEIVPLITMRRGPRCPESIELDAMLNDKSYLTNFRPKPTGETARPQSRR